MKITDLKVQGFKSFVDPVHLRIESGLTGIVGPNGCGKSNVLESLRWVMGATSAKALRGGEMDDVIFAGTDRRPARDIADVTIVLDNADGRAPAPFTDAPTLEVTRRIKRAAGSTFRVNGREVRARDVQLLFADASTGANSPALVRQNQVSELISAKPENRRRILEEASGISGLQARRHEAEMRLRGAQTNLERLDDILGHMEEALAGLKKQARQAERWKVVADEIRGLEALLLARRLEEADKAAATAREAVAAVERDLIAASARANAASRDAEAREAAIAPLREEQAIADAVLRRLEGKRIEIDRDLTAARQALEAAEDELTRIAGDVARETALQDDAREAVARLREELAALPLDAGLDAAIAGAEAAARAADLAREEAESALAAAIGAQAGLEADRRALARAADLAAGEAARRTKLAETARQALQAAEAAAPDPAALVVAREEEAAARDAADAAAGAADDRERAAEASAAEEARAREAARVAQNALDRLANEVAGLQAVLARAKTGDWPAAIHQVRVAPGHERAVAAAFGDDLDAALDPAAPWHWRALARPDAGIDWPAGVTPLAAHVEAPAALAARLAGVGVCADEATATRALALLPRGVRLVSPAGDLWRWDGLVRRADAAPAAAALLEQANRLALAMEALEPVRIEARTAAAAAAQARAHADSARAEARNARAAAPRAFAAFSAARDRAARLAAEIDRAADRLTAARAEADRAEAERAAAQAQADAARAALDAAPRPGDEALGPAREAALAARAAAADAAAEARALKGESAARAARRSKIEADLAAWTRRGEEAAGRLQALDRAGFDAENRREGAKAAPGPIADRRRALLDEAPRAEARKTAADDALAQAESALRAARDEDRAAGQALAALREGRAAAVTAAEAAVARAEELAEEARRGLQTDPADLMRRARAALADAAETLTAEAAAQRLAQAQRARDAIGGVNLRAAEEAEEQEARIAALKAERDDLTAAIAKLRGGVDEINTQGRERLLKAFEEVHGHFRVLFETLFDGGSAELRLTESDDPLGGGLEVYACPPGKRLQSMSLMSGGEQALTASALIFAVFLSNPSPICVLDEVDAPLDDSNVDRYCRLLDEMRRKTETRFLVITHHPITMARMDRLFGVTMAERGVSQVVGVDLQKAEALINLS
jgi:chromosome segregation protein